MKTMKTFSYRILSFCGCLMALMAGGCVKNEFKVDFEFPKDHFGNYLMTYYAWDKRGGRWMEHTASIQEGMAEVGGITRLPTLLYISDASRPDNMVMVYVERGDKIKITGEGNDIDSWTITGNKLSERWSDWRKGATAAKNDRKAFEKSIEDYVKANPKDELSAILLLTQWNRRENPEGFVRLWNSIDKDARSQRLVEICGVSDLMGVQYITNAEGGLEYAKNPKMKLLPLRSRDNGTDTLRFDRPSFLYFYTENNSARREAADSMRLLVRSYPDSSKRVLADIYMDSDSTAWTNAIRCDSLEGMVRAWQPRGLVEEDMVRMGVVRLPWFVVKDKTAKEVYAGSELGDAVAAFRKLAGKPDPKAAAKGKATGSSKEKDEAKAEPIKKDGALKGNKPAKASGRPSLKPETGGRQPLRPVPEPQNNSKR